MTVNTPTNHKTREDIITSMCYTWRHDYGLVKETNTHPHECGMTTVQQEILWKEMAQLFDNDIAPYMQFKKERKPRRTKEEKQIMAELGYSRVGYDAMRRGR